MVFDHIYEYSGFPDELYPAHLLARVVAPVFAYLLAQGMIYTRSRERYILRLFAFAAIMSLGNTVLWLITETNIPNNIFLSLALGASIIYFIDKAKEGKNRLLCITLALAAAMLSVFCEGGHLIPMSVVIFYYFRSGKIFMHAVYVLSTGLPYLLAYMLSGSLQTQFYMIFAVVPIMLYNGGRGPNTAFAKYFFYVFYPLHIWIIVFVIFCFSR